MLTSISSRRTPLEHEFTELLQSKVARARDCQLVRRVLGWDGRGGSSLKEAGEELGITRERARQIYDQASALIRGSSLSPLLDAALSVVNRQCNRDAGEVEAELQRRGFTKNRFVIRGLLKTAQLFGRAPKFTVEGAGGKLFVVAGAGVVPAILETAVHSSASQGVQTVLGLCQAIPQIHQRRNDRLLVRQVLNTRRDIRWLDAGENTFWLASVPRNPIVRCLKKVLCYASPASLSDLHRAIGRLPGRHVGALSRPLLIKFCEQLSFCRVVDGSAERVAPLSASKLVSNPEKIVCRILRKNGNELPIQRLQSLCLAAGVHKANLWRIVLYSPLIFRRAPRIYRVITPSSGCTQAIARRTA